MIYVFEQGDYEDRGVSAIYQGPAGLDLSLGAFLASLGLRPPPELADPPLPAGAVEVYEAARLAWNRERKELLLEHGIWNQEEEAHGRWLAAHPQLTAVAFELI